MISFANDYSQGAHPKVMEALNDTNLLSTACYGDDEYCVRARELIQKTFECPGADVHFLVGGTQTNMVALAAFLRPYEAVISVPTGHINVHETGAIEASGHKIVAVDTDDTKLKPEDIDRIFDSGELSFHMVAPKLVFIADATEYGEVYTLDELRALRACCNRHGLYLYIDGARLGTALMSESNDVKPGDLAKVADAFYIGGTKNGALFGEALVIVNDALKPCFRYMMKQRGGLLAKSRLLGVQFCALFENGLYFDIAANADRMARRLEQGLRGIGAHAYEHAQTNMVLMKFDTARANYIEEHFGLARMGADESGVVLRFVTSWGVGEKDVDDLVVALASIGPLEQKTGNTAV